MLLVLLHRAKGGGLSTLFGGGVQSSLSGSTVVEKNLDRLTLFVIGIWVVSSSAWRCRSSTPSLGARARTTAQRGSPRAADASHAPACLDATAPVRSQAWLAWTFNCPGLSMVRCSRHAEAGDCRWPDSCRGGRGVDAASRRRSRRCTHVPYLPRSWLGRRTRRPGQAAELDKPDAFSRALGVGRRYTASASPRMRRFRSPVLCPSSLAVI